MATDDLRLCHDPDGLEPAGRRIDLAQPSRTHALRPHRRTAATPQGTGHAALCVAQAWAMADRVSHHRLHELRPALLPG
ncbi:hypothetical protein D3C72_2305610 [compost metagenome]